MNFLKDNYKFLYEKFCDIPYLDDIEKKYNIKKNHIFIFLSIFISYYLIFGKTVEIVSRLLSVLYPGYETFLTLESKDFNKNGRKWLTYWIVNSSIITIETLGWMLLQLIPLYYLIKMFFIYWLISPQTNGCFIVYNKIIEPYLKKNKDSIDDFINETKDTLDNMKKNITTPVINSDDDINKKDE